ncbi:MAG: DUF3500 domain-containing protein [Microbacteriaceae bacterium]
MSDVALAPEMRWHRRVIRAALGSMAALALAGGLAATSAASSASASSRGSVSAVEAYSALTARLDSRQRAELAQGIELGDLDSEQREYVMQLARSLLSDEAYAQFTAVMAADDALDAAAGGGTEYSSAHYRVVAIDDPDGASFIQFGGTQLAINAKLADEVLFVEPDLV